MECSVRNTRFSRAVLLMTCLLLVGYGLPALAQEEELTPEQQAAMEQAMERSFEEEITVTGTLIPRPDVEGLSPVAVLGVEEVTFSGMTRIEDLVNQMPQAFSRQNSTLANGATGTATVDLRYLGSNRTLVLMMFRHERKLLLDEPSPEARSYLVYLERAEVPSETFTPDMMSCRTHCSRCLV